MRPNTSFKPVFILRMRLVSIVDASGVHALKTLANRCQRRSIVLIVSGLQAQPRRVIADMHLDERDGQLHFVSNYGQAVQLANSLLIGETLSAGQFR